MLAEWDAQRVTPDSGLGCEESPKSGNTNHQMGKAEHHSVEGETKEPPEAEKPEEEREERRKRGKERRKRK